MRLTLAVLCCAGSALSAQTSRARVFPPGYAAPIAIEDVTSIFELRAPASRAYAAIKAAFIDLGVPLDVDNAAGGVIGNKTITAVASFAGLPLSRLVDCGSSPRGSNADVFRVSLIVLALVDSTDATHTKVQVGVVGGAIPLGASIAAAVQCGSTGVIEEKLINLANKHL